jgi:hypothetical protein
MDSTEILNEIKNQLEQLEHKGYEKNSFKSGYLLGYTKALQLLQPDVSVRFLLVQWVNANPIIDGAIYFDTREDCLKYWESLPKINGIEVEYTICRIKNVH